MVLRKDDIEQLQAALDMVMKDPARRYTIISLAQHAAMCETKFKKLFRLHFGMPVLKYITIQKLHAAALLLKDTDYSIRYIARQAGYHHTGNFTTAFKKHFSASPSAYRIQCQK